MSFVRSNAPRTFVQYAKPQMHTAHGSLETSRLRVNESFARRNVPKFSLFLLRDHTNHMSTHEQKRHTDAHFQDVGHAPGLEIG